MTVLRRFESFAVGLLFVFSLLTSLYALLGHVPFTAVNFLQVQMIPGLAAFATWHAALTVLTGLVIAVAFWPDLQRRHTGVTLLVAILVIAAAGETWRPLFATAARYGLGAVLAIGALLPVMWLAVIRGSRAWPLIQWSRPQAVAPHVPDDARWLFSCLAAAVGLSVVDVLLWQIRAGGPTPDGIAWIVAGNLLIAGAIFTALMLIRGLSALRPSPAAIEFSLATLLLIVTVTFLLKHVVLAAIAFDGSPAWLMAAMLAVSIALTLASAALTARASSAAPVGSGIEVWLSPTGRAHRVGRTVATGAAVFLGGAVVIKSVAGMDWNSLLQQLGAVVVWGMALVWSYSISRSVRPRPVAAVTSAALVAPLLWVACGYTLTPDGAVTAANFAPSFRLVRSVSSASTATADDREFYAFLQDHTNLPRDRSIAPVDVRLVDHFVTPSSAPPNIFVIVIDSLRRDYLSPYRPSITFTPSIDAFAADSTVFTNAFTRYGATGLSEPSIWTGGMLPHKQYVLPFAPMNALAKVLNATGYRQYVSLDTVLHTLLEPSPQLVPLDATVQNKDYDLCRTLPELTEKLAATPSGTPVFAYTQPQTLHISSITRTGATVPADETYPGLYAPYASRVRQMDRCFGTFIETLKRTGQYDNSIIVFTADHGDSLGEDGRWGHAYTLFPEVVRVPLIVHLPLAARSQWQAHPDTLAFLTDITPSLYALLGQPPTSPNELFGRPLFAAPGAPPPAGRSPVMLTSSYGPVYGVLSNEGRQLYVIDAINLQDMAYELLTAGTDRKVTVSSAVRGDAKRFLQSQIELLSQFYQTDRSPSAQRHTP